MITRQEWSAAARLTRPRQWPILTAQWAVGVVLSVPRDGVLSAHADGFDPAVLAVAWLAWVVLLNGGTLAYNSAYDRDTEPVAYLSRPPVPPPWLATAAAAFMALGVVVGASVVGPEFGLVIGICVVLSVLYSHPAVRLKARPGLDLLTNMVGYGAATTAAGLLSGAAAAASPAALPHPETWWFALAFGLLFGSFYPLTQLYQISEDEARGDRTLATALGAGRALDLAVLLAVLAVPAFLRGLAAGVSEPAWLPSSLIGVALSAWLVGLVRWRRRHAAMSCSQHEHAMYVALGLWALVDAAVVAAWLL